jgi:hypothetical protein
LFHEFFFRLAGKNIISLIYFTILQVSHTGDKLVVSTELHTPATKEIMSVVRSGYTFKIQFYGSVIVNDQRVYRFEKIKSLQYRDSLWFINDTTVSLDSLQQHLGYCEVIFNKIPLKDNDQLLFYCSATILPDHDFEISTDLTTAILWNYYVPHIKLHGIISNGNLQFKE